MNIELFNNTYEFKKVEESFIDYIDVDVMTLKAYKVGILSFMTYLKQNNIKNPTRRDFKGYREVLKGKTSSNTINTYMTSVRALFKYLEAMGIYENITKDVKNVKTSSIPKRQTLSIEDVKEICKTLESDRDIALFSLAITTGLRAEEMASAKIENIKEYNGEKVLFVKCKKRDDESEYVKLSERVYKDILKYLNGRTEGNIFVSTSNNNYGGGMTNKSIRCIIKKIFEKNGICENGVSCHTLRRSFATISYNNGADIVSIQDVLHQKSIQTTRRYIQSAIRDNNKLESNMTDLLYD